MACKIHFWMLPYTGRYCVTPCTPPSSINKHKVGNKLSNFDQTVSTDFNSWLLFNNSYWNSFKKFNLHSWRLQVEASIVVKRHHHSWNLAKGAQMEIWNLWKKRKLIWITSFLHYISYITFPTLRVWEIGKRSLASNLQLISMDFLHQKLLYFLRRWQAIKISIAWNKLSLFLCPLNPPFIIS